MPRNVLPLLVLLLAGCNSRGYQREGGKWAWVFYTGNGREVRHLANAAGDLKVLSNPNYAATPDNVYLLGVQLPDADPATLTFLTYPYSRDKERVYAGTVPVTAANPNKFKVLGGLLEPQSGVTAEVFENIVGPINSVPKDTLIVGVQAWGIDDKSCFFGPTLIAGADPASFVPLGDYYAKDAKQVFCKHRTVEGADLASFRVTVGLAAQDKQHKYWAGKVKK